MKAEELFPGALVRVNRDGLCIKKDTIVEVRAVDADDKLIEKGLIGSAHCRPLDDNQFDGGIWCEYLDPLPLTPEILEKNRFECNSNTKTFYRILSNEPKLVVEVRLWDKDTNVRIGKQCDGTFRVGYDWYINGMEIHFVHQLQHALRLCGIDKTIEL